MPDTITITGVVGTIPKHIRTTTDLDITSFRVASTQRRFDRRTQSWIDGETNWYTVTAFRSLAVNVVASLEKGQRVLVTGRLRMTPWQKEDRSGTNVEIEADAIGHDLGWGTTSFSRVLTSVRREDDAVATTSMPGELPAEEPEREPDGWAASTAQEHEAQVPF